MITNGIFIIWLIYGRILFFNLNKHVYNEWTEYLRKSWTNFALSTFYFINVSLISYICTIFKSVWSRISFVIILLYRQQRIYSVFDFIVCIVKDFRITRLELSIIDWTAYTASTLLCFPSLFNIPISCLRVRRSYLSHFFFHHQDKSISRSIFCCVCLHVQKNIYSVEVVGIIVKVRFIAESMTTRGRNPRLSVSLVS